MQRDQQAESPINPDVLQAYTRRCFGSNVHDALS